uniref:Uncharacterized protein n=1 Tax=Kalanchoe fedtschenkoi TaxID=63787 RepID=A0A7N0USL1_KALFE
MVIVDQNIFLNISLNFSDRLAKSHFKYQELQFDVLVTRQSMDLLILLIPNEDLDNIFEEYDRVCKTTMPTRGKASRLRLLVLAGHLWWWAILSCFL